MKWGSRRSMAPFLRQLLDQGVGGIDVPAYSVFEHVGNMFGSGVAFLPKDIHDFEFGIV